MMRISSIISAISAASLCLGVFALPHSKKGTSTLNARQSQESSTPYSTLSRLNPNYTQEQLNEIKLAYTEVDKLKLLRSYGDTDDYFKFDFTPAGFISNAGNGLGGQGYLAAVQNYPVLMGTGLSMAIGFLNPCGFDWAFTDMMRTGGLDSMHIHNRATEMVILVAGQSLKTGFVMEDGFDEPVLTTIGLYQGTIRPQGSIHYEFNDNCEPAVFIAGLSSEDPGVSRTAQNFFVEDPETVKADLGYPHFLENVDIAQFAGAIPEAFALGARECLQRCGISSNTTSPN